MANDKFKALVHHVVSSCDDPNKLGAVRLNKILWFCDALAFRMHGVPMTGEKYVKRQFGPVPKTILRTLDELKEDGAILVRDKPSPLGGKIRHFISLSEPSDSVFSTQEQALIEAVLEQICENHTANSISSITHDQVWEAANIGEEIPFEATLASIPGELTDDVLKWGAGVVDRVAA